MSPTWQVTFPPWVRSRIRLHVPDRFKQMCETLLLDDPIDYGLKIIDLLWRKAAYDPIQIFKRDRQEYDESTMIEVQIKYRMHLSAVFGFYSNLLMKLAPIIKPHRNLHHFFDFIQLSSETKRRSADVSRSITCARISLAVHFNRNDNLVEGLLKLLHKCLVCLGDISRYLSEFDGATQTAEKYYTMAILLDPEIGEWIFSLSLLELIVVLV